jgi:hypothetical protein
LNFQLFRPHERLARAHAQGFALGDIFDGMGLRD